MKLQKIEKDSWYVCIKDVYNSKGKIEFQSGKVYHAPKDNYLIRDDNGQPEIIGAFLIEHFKLWSVKDAKPGDFLTYSSDEHKDWYFIYHSEYKPYDSHHHYFAGYSDEFLPGGTACVDEDGLRPSTHEECDLLLHKIEEAGYHWDAENRKLIKNKEENEVKQKMTDEESIIQYFGEWQHEMVRKTGFVYGYIRQVVRNFLNGFEEPGNNYFKWEVIHLIEKALQHKDDGVKAYARKLAHKYNKDGQDKYADCILSAIGEKEIPMATMDENTVRMTVITLCGSTRFKEQFLEQQKRLTLEGNVVISVGLFGHSGDEEVWKPGMKEMLDKMHFQKIDMADEIFVINVGGYIGESTKREIAYAESEGKVINYLEEET